MARSAMPWRQLLTNPPSSWQRLPLLTRGVGDEVLRALDSDGEIDCGSESPAAVVCRLTGAHPRERRRVAEALDELSAAGFLSISSGVVRGHFPDLASRPKRAADAPEADAKSTRSEPEADVNPTQGVQRVDVNPTRSQPEVEDKPAQSFNSGPVDKSREDKIRSDQNAGATDCVFGDVAEGGENPEPPTPVLGWNPQRLSAVLSECRKRVGGGPYGYRLSAYQSLDDACGVFAEANPDDPADAAEWAFAEWAKTKWAIDAKWPVSAFLADAGKHLGG